MTDTSHLPIHPKPQAKLIRNKPWIPVLEPDYSVVSKLEKYWLSLLPGLKLKHACELNKSLCFNHTHYLYFSLITF